MDIRREHVRLCQFVRPRCTQCFDRTGQLNSWTRWWRIRSWSLSWCCFSLGLSWCGDCQATMILLESRFKFQRTLPRRNSTRKYHGSFSTSGMYPPTVFVDRVYVCKCGLCWVCSCMLSCIHTSKFTHTHRKSGSYTDTWTEKIMMPTGFSFYNLNLELIYQSMWHHAYRIFNWNMHVFIQHDI